MSSKRLYYVLLGFVGLLILGLFGGAYGANSVFQKQSQKLVDLKLQNQVASQRQTDLVRDKKDIATYSPLQKIAQSIVPQDKDQAEAVREIVNIANQSGITLATISFPASTLGANSASGGTSTVKPSAGASSTSLSQLAPVPTISGVYDLQIIVQSDTTKPVAYDSFISFLTKLENNRRTAQVNEITLQPNADQPNLLTFTLTLDEYIKP